MEHAPQERDSIPSRGTTRIGVLIVAVTIASSAIAYGLLRLHLAGVPTGEPHTAITALEIAGVEQVHALDGWAVRLQIAQHNRLESYGWVDAAHTQVHVPIERAMHDEALRGAE